MTPLPTSALRDLWRCRRSVEALVRTVLLQLETDNVGESWKEYLKRIKLAFDANGVQMQTANLRLIPPDQRLPPPADHSHAAE